MTFGLLSQVSPCGRYVISTVKDRSVFVPRPDLYFSQLFFPLKGVLAIYDRETKTYTALPGADDPQYVQSNPAWSPNGQEIVFARSTAYPLRRLRDTQRVLLTADECKEFLEEGKKFKFDLYRVPFNGGKGGEPVPIEGASNNGMSNFFPKYSPDGKWIVFCRADSFMLLQPDSELYIIPAEGGEARRLRCNTDRMNSWHSGRPTASGSRSPPRRTVRTPSSFSRMSTKTARPRPRASRTFLRPRPGGQYPRVRECVAGRHPHHAGKVHRRRVV